MRDSDPRRQDHLERLLSDSDFEIVPFREAPSRRPIDVTVIDTAILSPARMIEDRVTSGLEGDPGRWVTSSAYSPVLFVADAVADLDDEAMTALFDVDYLMRPFSDAELLHRVRILVAAVHRRISLENRAEALRASARDVVGRMQSLNEPEAIAVETVRGAATTFDLDDACLITFDDARVPRLSVSSRSGMTPPQDTESPTDRAAAVHAARVVAEALWSAGSVRVVDRTGPALSDLQGLTALLPRVAEGSWLIVPFGQGNTPLGLLCFGDDDPQRTWSPLERSLTQHLASNFAPALMQGHLITVQQQVVERMRELDLERDSMIATVNHELRTPLTSILAYLELVRDGEGGDLPEEAAQMLLVVERNAARLRALVDDAMTLSQRNSPQRSVRAPAPVDIVSVLRAVVASLWPIASARGVRLTVTATAGDPAAEVVGHEGELERVFTNILGNAVKFTPDGRSVDIVITRHAVGTRAEVVVVVTDEGVGIPEKEIPRLFTRFYRASNAMRAAVPGTGLGLSIAQEIVTRHHGTIGVRSTLDVGTAVTVILPAAPAPAASATPAAVDPAGSESAGH